MNWTTICRVSGFVVALGLAIFMALEWPHLYSGVRVFPIKGPGWDGYMPIVGILAGLMLAGATLRRSWIKVMLAWLGCAVVVLWLVDLLLFAGCRFDFISIAIAILGALCIAYGRLGRLARPFSLVLLLFASSAVIVLIFLALLAVTGRPRSAGEIKDLPTLAQAKPEQAAAYAEWMKLIPRDDQNVIADPDRDAFNEAAAQVHLPKIVTGDISAVKPLLPRMQPFLNKYWSFLAADEPVQPIDSDSRCVSLTLMRTAAQMEVCTIRSLLDDGNVKAAEERYVRALKGMSNTFAGAHGLVETQCNATITGMFMELLVANADRFFLEANSLHPGLDPQPSAAELSAADLQANRFKSFSATPEQVSLLTLLSSLPARISAASTQAFLAEGQWMDQIISSRVNRWGDKTATSDSIMQRLWRSVERGSNVRVAFFR